MQTKLLIWIGFPCVLILCGWRAIWINFPCKQTGLFHQWILTKFNSTQTNRPKLTMKSCIIQLQANKQACSMNECLCIPISSKHTSPFNNEFLYNSILCKHLDSSESNISLCILVWCKQASSFELVTFYVMPTYIQTNKPISSMNSYVFQFY